MRYDDYLKKLEVRNRVHRQQEKTSGYESLKQRENGFQLYVNGAHHTRPSSASHKRTPTPTRHRRWPSTRQTKIKTTDGSIIADINSTLPPPINTTYRLNTDQSWMPEWCFNLQDNRCKCFVIQYIINRKHFLALSFDDLPKQISQETYRLSTEIGM